MKDSAGASILANMVQTTKADPMPKREGIKAITAKVEARADEVMRIKATANGMSKKASTTEQAENMTATTKAVTKTTETEANTTRTTAVATTVTKAAMLEAVTA